MTDDDVRDLEFVSRLRSAIERAEKAEARVAELEAERNNALRDLELSVSRTLSLKARVVALEALCKKTWKEDYERGRISPEKLHELASAGRSEEVAGG